MLKKLTHNTFILFLTSILILILLPTTAFGAKTINKIPQATIKVPGTKELEITFTNVASLYSDTGYTMDIIPDGDIAGRPKHAGEETAYRSIQFYIYDDSTVSFNKTVEILSRIIVNNDYEDTLKVINVGETISGKELLNGDNYLQLLEGKNLVLLDTSSSNEYSLTNESDFFNVTFYTLKWLEQSWVNKDAIELSNIITESAPVAPTFSVLPTNAKVLINGVKVEFDAYNIDGSNYFKLRDVAYAIKQNSFIAKNGYYSSWFDVDYENGNTYIRKTHPYKDVGGEMKPGDGKAKNASQSSDKFYDYNAQPLNMSAYKISGNNYVKLQDLSKAVGFTVEWNDETKTIDIITIDKTANEFIDEFYPIAKGLVDMRQKSANWWKSAGVIFEETWDYTKTWVDIITFWDGIYHVKADWTQYKNTLLNKARYAENTAIEYANQFLHLSYAIKNGEKPLNAETKKELREYAVRCVVFETASAELIMAMNEPQNNSSKNDENKEWIAKVTSELLEYAEPVDGFVDFLETLDGFDEIDKAKDFERIFKSLIAKIETEMNENYAKFNYLYAFR